MKTVFTDTENKEIIHYALQLLQRGFLTGINFIQSDQPLPSTAIVIHYLHNVQQHAQFVVNSLRQHAPDIF